MLKIGKQSANRRTDNVMVNRKRTKRQAVMYNTLHRRLKIEHHKLLSNPRVHSGAPEGKVDPALLVTPVVFLLCDTNIVGHQYA